MLIAVGFLRGNMVLTLTHKLDRNLGHAMLSRSEWRAIFASQNASI